MNDFLKLFPLDMWLAIVPIILASVACVLAPFYMPAFVVLKNRKTMRKRLLFLFIVPIIVYGVTALFLIFLVPVESFFIFIYPSLTAANLSRPIWLARVYDFLSNYWFYFYAVFSALSGFVLTKYLYRRWEALVNAMV